jgi:hypothetical protein
MILWQQSTLLFSGKGFSDIDDDFDEDKGEVGERMVAHVEHDSIMTAVLTRATPGIPAAGHVRRRRNTNKERRDEL